MSNQVSSLISQFPELDLQLHGNGNQANSVSFDAILPFEESRAGSLIFVERVNQLHKSQLAASVIVTTKDVASNIDGQFGGAVLTTKNVRLAQALIRQQYDDYQFKDKEWLSESNIHQSACVHATASLGNGVSIGLNCVVGANCKIGDNTSIRSNTILESDVTIGANSIIQSLVNIGYQTSIGDNVLIDSGTKIGSQGYGYASDQNKQHHRIPHTGKVTIENDVCIGANCAIDRATFGETLIKRGTKIDNQCHIAHNVTIGEDCLITAQCVIAGSSKIGDRVIMSGQTGVIDHINIVDDVVLVHRAGVIEDINESGMWAGLPAKPFKEYVVNQNLSKKLKRLEAKLKKSD